MKYSQSIEINLGNQWPAFDQTDNAERISVWEEASLLFSPLNLKVFEFELSSFRYSFRLNASDVIDFLKAGNNLDKNDQQLQKRFIKRANFGFHVASSSLVVHVNSSDKVGLEPCNLKSAMGRFLQQFFLTMNLSLPGSFTLYSSKYQDERLFDNQESRYGFPAKNLPLTPPSLSGGSLESAFIHSKERGWPSLSRLPLEKVWMWLFEELPFGLNLTEEAHQIALFNLLRIVGNETNESDRILLIAQSLESLLLEPKDNKGSTLKNRLGIVLGMPKTHNNWFNKFYQRRSKIAHGSMPVLRPGKVYDEADSDAEKFILEFYQPLDEGISVLLALLQDLIKSSSRGYLFPETLERLTR